jgi:hypothetical protein
MSGQTSLADFACGSVSWQIERMQAAARTALSTQEPVEVADRADG